MLLFIQAALERLAIFEGPVERFELSERYLHRAWEITKGEGEASALGLLYEEYLEARPLDYDVAKRSTMFLYESGNKSRPFPRTSPSSSSTHLDTPTYLCIGAIFRAFNQVLAYMESPLGQNVSSCHR